MYDYESIIMDCHTCAEIGCGRRECSHKDADGCEAQLLIDAACAIDELCRVQLGADWISVEERLPDDQCDDARAARGGDYIHKVLAVSVTPNYTAMDTAYLYNGRWVLGQYTSWKHFMGAPVTHWMPLPVPPKEDA